MSNKLKPYEYIHESNQIVCKQHEKMVCSECDYEYVKRLEQENRRYHEVLEFYGNKNNYMKYVGMQPITPTIEIDSGKKAREVINND